MPKRQLKLSDPQFDFLAKIVNQPTSAVESYGPARKLVEIGFATRTEGRYGALTHTVTEAGLAHHQAVSMADKTCGRCKTAPWTCSRCGRKTCEHYCVGKKTDGTAICGRCRSR